MKEEVNKMEFRNLDMEKAIRVLIELLAKQEGVVIEYTIEKNNKIRQNGA